MITLPMSMRDLPGAGDGPYPYTGHPGDPATPELDDAAMDIVCAVELIKEYNGSAVCALARNDYAAAGEALAQIHDLLEDHDWSC